MTAFERGVLLPESFVEMRASERAFRLLDGASGKELAGPFAGIRSPWLGMQGLPAQSDDGCVIVKGTLGGLPVVVAALEGGFLGGSIGEVSGAKLAAALEMARRDSERGQPRSAILVLETGGVRLQESNLGLAAVAVIHDQIIRLRSIAPVIAIIAGPGGCFGGMSIAAGLASYVVMTREGRLGMNGPEVIEQEAGVEEFDSSDRRLIWAIHGGAQRFAMGLVDALVDDDAQQIVETVGRLLRNGVASKHRSADVERYQKLLEVLDPQAHWSPEEVTARWAAEEEMAAR